MDSFLVSKKPVELNWQWILFGFWISLAIHILVMGLVVFFSARLPFSAEESRSSIPVELVQRPQELVDSLQEAAKEPPKDAKFISDRDLKTNEETSPDFASQTASLGSSSATRSSRKPAGNPQKRESFSLSKEEMVALNDPLQGGRGDRRKFSPGFVERLKRGEALKTNAYGLDYGQYYLRMRERLQQRWRPQPTVVPAMYNYNEVRVGVAIVLDDKGELLDLEVISPSLFPAYDQAAIDAFKEAAPFPNPPRSIVQDDGKVYVQWNMILYTRGWGSGKVE